MRQDDFLCIASEWSNICNIMSTWIFRLLGNEYYYTNNFCKTPLLLRHSIMCHVKVEEQCVFMLWIKASPSLEVKTQRKITIIIKIYLNILKLTNFVVMCQRAESGERHRGKNTKSVSFFATVVAKDQCFIFAKAENSSGSPHVFGQTPEELREKKRWLNPFGGTPICRESADSAVSRRLCRLCLLSPDAAVSEFAQVFRTGRPIFVNFAIIKQFTLPFTTLLNPVEMSHFCKRRIQRNAGRSRTGKETFDSGNGGKDLLRQSDNFSPFSIVLFMASI